MKLELSAMLLGLLGANSVMGAEVLTQGFYLEDGCSGTPVAQTTLGFGNQCVKISAGSSFKYGCSEFVTFANGDCSGSGTSAAIPTGCISSGSFSSKQECVTVSDNKLAKVALGTGCSDGELTGAVGEVFIVLDECLSSSFLLPVSFKYTAVDGGVKFTMFTEKNDCTGASESATVPVGECSLTSVVPALAGRRLQEGQAAVFVTPAVEGATLGGGSSSAMSASASAFAFVAALFGAFATMA